MNNITILICDKLGWTISEINGADVVYDANDNFICDNPDFRTSPQLAKLLQAKMVEDGWRIIIEQYSPDKFRAIAWQEIWEGKVFITQIEHQTKIIPTEQLAIVALFCKIYGIENEKTQS
jgi:hypothetical protein